MKIEKRGPVAIVQPIPPPPVSAQLFAQIGVGALLEVFAAFVKRPIQEAFLLLRTLLINLPPYQPYTNEIQRVEELFEEGQFPKARAAANKTMPNYLLTPRIHLIAALTADKQEDYEARETERMAYQACIEGILGTGDGTEASPYLITHVTDEYDILSWLHKRSRIQSKGKAIHGTAMLSRVRTAWRFGLTLPTSSYTWRKPCVQVLTRLAVSNRMGCQSR
jgi:hypothetical protein